MNGQPNDRRVLFFGDSLVAGVRDPAGKGWVGRVVAASFAEGLALTAYNLGVRGETSAAGRRALACRGTTTANARHRRENRAVVRRQ